MPDELSRLLDLPAAAKLIAADGELQVLTITHEHADKVSIERKRLGSSIDLVDLLSVIGLHGLAESQVQVTEIPQPQLPAPVEEQSVAQEPEQPDPPATEEEITLPPMHTCLVCQREFITLQALGAHVGRRHKQTLTPRVDPFACPKCGRTFKSERTVAAHLAVGHPDEAQAAAAEPKPAGEKVPCPECGAMFHQRGLGPHMKGHKAKAAPAAPTDDVQMSHAEHMAALEAMLPEPLVLRNAQTVVHGLCDTCRKPEMLHDRCADCTMLLGPHHLAGPVHIRYNDHDYCSSCWAFRAAAQGFGIEIKETER